MTGLPRVSNISFAILNNGQVSKRWLGICAARGTLFVDWKPSFKRKIISCIRYSIAATFFMLLAQLWLCSLVQNVFRVVQSPVNIQYATAHLRMLSEFTDKNEKTIKRKAWHRRTLHVDNLFGRFAVFGKDQSKVQAYKVPLCLAPTENPKSVWSQFYCIRKKRKRFLSSLCLSFSFLWLYFQMSQNQHYYPPPPQGGQQPYYGPPPPQAGMFLPCVSFVGCLTERV